MNEYSETWFISREFPLFCRELKYVAKYAFYVLFFGLKSGIRANLYAFPISVLKVDFSVLTRVNCSPDEDPLPFADSILRVEPEIKCR